MNRCTAVTFGFLLVLSAGCGPHRTAGFVPVPEAQFRSEVRPNEALPLPLNPADRDYLLRFLMAGGNQDNVGDATGVIPEAPARYSELLELLSRPENLALTNLTETARFKRWFPKPAVRQVMDAREEAPLHPQPLAFKDARGKFWWILYHRQKRVHHLLVIQAVPERQER